MNRTLGYTLIIGALAGAAHTGTSWWLGKQIEAEYNRKIDQFAKEYAADFTVIDRQYERGIFSARATLTLQIEVPEGAEPESTDWDECGACEDPDNGDASASDAAASIDADATAGMATAALEAGNSTGIGIGTRANATAAGEDTPDPSDAETRTNDGGGDEGTDPSSADEPLYRIVQIPLISDIRHGPLAGFSPTLAAIHTRVGQIQGIELDEDMKQALAGVKPPTATTVVDFDRKIRGQVLMPAATIASPQTADTPATTDDHLMRWDELRFDYRITDGAHPFQGELHWPAFSAHIAHPELPLPALALDMKNWRSRFESALPDASTLFAPGNFRDEFDSLQIRFTPPGATEMQNLVTLDRVGTETRITKHGEALKLDSTTESVGRLGTAVMEKFSIKTTLDNLHEAAVLSLMDLASAPEPYSISDDPDADSDGLDAEPEPSPFDEPLRQLFGARPEMRISLSATIGGETGGLHQTIKLLPLPPQPPGNPASSGISTSIDADSSLRLPKTWPTLLTPPAKTSPDDTEGTSGNLLEDGIRWAVEQGALKDEGQHWSATASVKGGKITVNGMASGQL